MTTFDADERSAKMARFKLGDLVRVIDEADRYPGYDDFFENNNVPYGADLKVS